MWKWGTRACRRPWRCRRLSYPLRESRCKREPDRDPKPHSECERYANCLPFVTVIIGLCWTPEWW